MRFNSIAQYSNYGMRALNLSESFWENPDVPTAPFELIRFSTFLGILVFAGYLFSYSVVGRVWNYWPFIQSTLSIVRGIMCAGLQWVFFATFPVLSSLILDSLFVKERPSPWLNSWVVVCTYSATPLFIAALFVGIPFFGRIAAVLGSATFIYLLFYGYRNYCRHSIVRSALLTLLVFLLFAVIRQMFVYVIGF
ncbi:MAG: hypothetical protein C5B54_11940 [Acidobacteria bacterium]|nr:MAG: hypothetical protein C5B54_11940 [Acidobacteriota bacterium]